jgi:primosomal protein N' (replication factor Y)
LQTEFFHPTTTAGAYVSVILPLALPKPYTYSVPEELIAQVQVGIRVEVPFGKGGVGGQGKLHTALVIEVLAEHPGERLPKPILSVIDEQPIVHPVQIRLWQWLAEYYCCTPGEVMHAALPAHLKLSGETRLTLSPLYENDISGLSDKEYLIAEALNIQQEISIEDVRKILNQKTVYPIIRKLLDKKVVYLKEDLKERYTPKTIACLRLQEPYASHPERIGEAFDQLNRALRQAEALMGYIQLSKKQEFVRRQELYTLAKVDATIINGLVQKGIFEVYEREVSRLSGYEDQLLEADELSDQQVEALRGIRDGFAQKQVTLLHGVTGSGKTRIYVELIREAIERGEQVLYLLPEIALTTQIIDRLQKVFGDDIAVYHSRLNNNERVEMWNSVLDGKPVILGARSALFLPFKQLGLIVVDEEHDPSYKQQDPNPRYNGRDTAIFLAGLHGAKTLLGTATPSIESYYNAQSGKYALVEMKERFGGLEMPEMVVADAKKELKERKLQSHFTTALIDELKAALERGEQAILFQNRRGYAPTYRCASCGWSAQCTNCDVSLTYHKATRNLKCHYCGYQSMMPNSCPDCGNRKLILIGFGTEKIEDELSIYLPHAKIARMDLDTVRSKNAHSRIINDFEEKRTEILVGTQMVTKGLDFENVGIVGVLSADQLLQFPDFRASERAFQLMVQVSGRAGRKHKRGKVLIQTFNTAHPVLREVLDNDFATFFAREIRERHEFRYPPFSRLIRITLKHKKPEVVNEGGELFAKFLKAELGARVLGPAVPSVARVRSFYLLDVLLKLERDSALIQRAKHLIADATHHIQSETGLSGVRVNVDVDPY